MPSPHAAPCSAEYSAVQPLERAVAFCETLVETCLARRKTTTSLGEGESMKGNKQNDVRRDNLRTLIHQHDGPAALARRLGYRNAAFLVQMAGPNPSRPVTERTARDFEDKLGLPAGWLDRTVPSAPVAGEAPSRPIDSALVTEVLRLVAESCETMGVTLAHARFADVVALLYTEALEEQRLPRAE